MSELISIIGQEAEALGLSGQERTSYVKDRLKEERERLERKEKEEQERKDRIAAQDRHERIAKEEREHALELEKLRLQAQNPPPADRRELNPHQPKLPKLPSFIDGREDLDSWLLRFERFAQSSKWEKENWTTFLSALLTGRALDCYCRLSVEEAKDYDAVKKALQIPL